MSGEITKFYNALLKTCMKIYMIFQVKKNIQKNLIEIEKLPSNKISLDRIRCQRSWIHKACLKFFFHFSLFGFAILSFQAM